MSLPVLAFGPPLADSSGPDVSNIRSLNAELLERASRDDYHEWLNGALAAAGCVRPIQLRGTIRDLDTATGEIIHSLDTSNTPDGVIYLRAATGAPRSARPAPKPTGPTPIS